MSGYCFTLCNELSLTGSQSSINQGFRRRTNNNNKQEAVKSSSSHTVGVIDATIETSYDEERRQQAARTLIRELLSTTTTTTPSGCEQIACEDPPKSFLNLTALSELTFRAKAIPTVENSYAQKCSLVTSSRIRSGEDNNYQLARRWRCRKTNKYIAYLFEQIAENTEFTLSRFDLFHAHLFYLRENNTIGLLFHAMEYCRFDEEHFDIELGYCQNCSSIEFDREKMFRRNILWLSSGLSSETKLFILNTNLAHSELLFPGQIYTMYESDFGDILGDVFYFGSLKNQKPQDRVYFVPRNRDGQQK